jgi:hypothetical protein
VLPLGYVMLSRRDSTAHSVDDAGASPDSLQLAKEAAQKKAAAAAQAKEKEEAEQKKAAAAALAKEKEEAEQKKAAAAALAKEKEEAAQKKAAEVSTQQQPTPVPLCCWEARSFQTLAPPVLAQCAQALPLLLSDFRSRAKTDPRGQTGL